jgi:hypothetical protein
MLGQWRWCIDQAMLQPDGRYISADRYVHFHAHEVLSIASDLHGFNKPVIALIQNDRMLAKYGYTRNRKRALIMRMMNHNQLLLEHAERDETYVTPPRKVGLRPRPEHRGLDFSARHQCVGARPRRPRKTHQRRARKATATSYTTRRHPVTHPRKPDRRHHHRPQPSPSTWRGPGG